MMEPSTPLLLRLAAEAGEIWKHCIVPRLDGVDALVLRGTCSGLRREVEKPKKQDFDWECHRESICFDISHMAVVVSMAMLRWARERGYNWSEATSWAAAGGGHLETLKWAREHGCPWGASTCTFAAMGGHLETLKWAREHGCHWCSVTFLYARLHSHAEVAQWALANGCLDWSQQP